MSMLYIVVGAALAVVGGLWVGITIPTGMSGYTVAAAMFVVGGLVTMGLGIIDHFETLAPEEEDEALANGATPQASQEPQA